MVQFTGKYKLESSNNMPAFFDALDIPAEVLEKLIKPGGSSEVKQESDETFILSTETGSPLTITIGKEYKETFGPHPKTGIAEKNGNRITVNATYDSDPSRKVTKIYEFTDKGYTVTMEYNNITATRVYVRL